MAWLFGKSLRCILGSHWWITWLIEPPADYYDVEKRRMVCGRKGCGVSRTQYGNY